MSDVTDKWSEAGVALGGIGAKLKAHYGEQTEAGTEESRVAVGAALDRLVAALTDGFEALGSAAKDPAVRGDVSRAGAALTDAIAATFTEAAGDVREAYARRRTPPPTE